MLRASGCKARRSDRSESRSARVLSTSSNCLPPLTELVNALAMARAKLFAPVSRLRVRSVSVSIVSGNALTLSLVVSSAMSPVLALSQTATVLAVGKEAHQSFDIGAFDRPAGYTRDGSDRTAQFARSHCPECIG